MSLVGVSISTEILCRAAARGQSWGRSSVRNWGERSVRRQKYAALVEVCGYVPVALEGDDYIELLPAEWRAVNDYGIRIKIRTYNSADLGPMRRQHSGIMAKRGLWEIHREPYNVSRIWVGNHRGRSEWVPAVWTHLKRVPVPSASWPGTTRLASCPEPPRLRSPTPSPPC
ncbi:hypothetical protein ACWEF9_37750 [Streptomyces sp. NPDC004980]